MDTPTPPNFDPLFRSNKPKISDMDLLPEQNMGLMRSLSFIREQLKSRMEQIQSLKKILTTAHDQMSEKDKAQEEFSVKMTEILVRMKKKTLEMEELVATETETLAQLKQKTEAMVELTIKEKEVLALLTCKELDMMKMFTIKELQVLVELERKNKELYLLDYRGGLVKNSANWDDAVKRHYDGLAEELQALLAKKEEEDYALNDIAQHDSNAAKMADDQATWAARLEEVHQTEAHHQRVHPALAKTPEATAKSDLDQLADENANPFEKTQVHTGRLAEELRSPQAQKEENIKGIEEDLAPPVEVKRAAQRIEDKAKRAAQKAAQKAENQAKYEAKLAEVRHVMEPSPEDLEPNRIKRPQKKENTKGIEEVLAPPAAQKAENRAKGEAKLAVDLAKRAIEVTEMRQDVKRRRKALEADKNKRTHVVKENAKDEAHQQPANLALTQTAQAMTERDLDKSEDNSLTLSNATVALHVDNTPNLPPPPSVMDTLTGTLTREAASGICIEQLPPTWSQDNLVGMHAYFDQPPQGRSITLCCAIPQVITAPYVQYRFECHVEDGKWVATRLLDWGPVPFNLAICRWVYQDPTQRWGHMYTSIEEYAQENGPSLYMDRVAAVTDFCLLAASAELTGYFGPRIPAVLLPSIQERIHGFRQASFEHGLRLKPEVAWSLTKDTNLMQDLTFFNVLFERTCVDGTWVPKAKLKLPSRVDVEATLGRLKVLGLVRIRGNDVAFTWAADQEAEFLSMIAPQPASKTVDDALQLVPGQIVFIETDDCESMLQEKAGHLSLNMYPKRAKKSQVMVFCNAQHLDIRLLYDWVGRGRNVLVVGSFKLASDELISRRSLPMTAARSLPWTRDDARTLRVADSLPSTRCTRVIVVLPEMDRQRRYKQIQNVIGALTRQKLTKRYRAMVIVADGDQVELDWYSSTPFPNLIPGIISKEKTAGRHKLVFGTKSTKTPPYVFKVEKVELLEESIRNDYVVFRACPHTLLPELDTQVADLAFVLGDASTPARWIHEAARVSKMVVWFGGNREFNKS